ncbi:MAG: hypothetical protein ACJAV3_001038 [Alcanivorax sp.]|jgi:hypothetical protein
MHPGALAPRHHQLTLAQLGQMPGHRGLRRTDRIHQITHTNLALTVQQTDQTQAKIIAEAFAELSGSEHGPPCIRIFGNTDIKDASDKLQAATRESFVTMLERQKAAPGTGTAFEKIVGTERSGVTHVVPCGSKGERSE